MYNYTSLRPSQITSHFPGCVPCNCNDDAERIYKIPRYDVKLRLGYTYCKTSNNDTSRNIKEIRVECDCCGAVGTYDVESYDVFVKDLNW